MPVFIINFVHLLTFYRAEVSTGYTLTFGHSSAQPWPPECPNVRN